MPVELARDLRQLVRLDRRRLAAFVRRPSLASGFAVLLPLVLVGAGLWSVGRASQPAAAGSGGILALALLVAGVLSFMAYGTLFRGQDDAFLKQLGLRFEALHLERSLRLALAGTLLAGALVVPFAAAGQSIASPFAVALTTALITAGSASLAFAVAARLTTTGGGGALAAGMRNFDPELARAAPLVYAPLIPFLIGSAAGVLTLLIEDPSWGVPTALVLALASAAASAAVYREAAPRFFPRTREMAYVPPPDAGADPFVARGGVARLLPRSAALVWRRDATVGARRFGWAARVTWPVTLVALVALARWGSLPETRTWVVLAAGLALVVQSGAVIGIGRLERRGPRWVDHSLGLATAARFLGRWTWAWGLSLWMLVPLALAWGFWSSVGGAWLWPAAGAITAAVSSVVSLLEAQRR